MKRILFIISLIFLVSCAGQGTRNHIRKALQGKWSTDCLNRQSESLDFSGDHFESISTTYTDTACTFAGLTLRQTGTFATGVPASIPENSYKIDYAIELISLTSENDEMTEYLNDSQYCGVIKWETQVPKDVMGLSCGRKDPVTYAKQGFTLFNIISIKEKYLFVGEQTASFYLTSDETRPIELSAFAYQRK